MSLLNKIREWAGIKSIVLNEEQPIDTFEKADKELAEFKLELKKAQVEYDTISNDFELKILACDKLIEKGSSEGGYNKKALNERLDRITNDFLEKAKTLTAKINETQDQRDQLEFDILSKSVEITALLSEEDQNSIGDIMSTWNETKLIKGEEVNSQLRAIVTSIDLILKADIDLFQKEEQKKSEVESKIGDEAIEKAESFENHYANVIVKKDGKILFLKRASDKKIAPNQWCLPGGHIDAGESIQQAAARELEEEANLTCDPSCMWIIGKAKCDDNKWAFYLSAYPQGEVALLDGESSNAKWMKQDEWMDADLFFDLKDHLIAMEFPEFSIDSVPTLTKAEDFFFDLEKAGTHKYIKKEQGKNGKQKYIYKIPDLVAHAENTSHGALHKVSKLHPEQHIRDSAKRELERRKADKEKKEQPKQVDTNAPQANKELTKVVKKKKKPAFEYNANQSLSSEHSAIEKEFGKHLTKNYKKSKEKYEKQYGNVLSGDNAKELSDTYNKNKAEYANAVHAPSSSFTWKMYNDKLQEKTPKGKSNLVYFTAGGTGVGKSSSLKGKEKAFVDKAHIVYDTNMNGVQSSSEKIDAALKAGKDVKINFVYRDPKEAFENGVVPRAIKEGRTIPIEVHLDTHIGGVSTILGLKEKYNGNKKVQIVVTDNSRGLGKSKQVPVETLKKWEKKYSHSELRDDLRTKVDSLLNEGKISQSHHKGFKG